MAKQTKASTKKAPRKVAPKKIIVHDNSINTHTKKSTVPAAPKAVEISAESIYNKFIGAEINTERPQPKKLTDVFVDIVGEHGMVETHLVDLRQVPQEIVETFVGELQ